MAKLACWFVSIYEFSELRIADWFVGEESLQAGMKRHRARSRGIGMLIVNVVLCILQNVVNTNLTVIL